MKRSPNRTLVVSFRTGKKGLAMLQGLAKLDGKSVADYIRHALMEKTEDDLKRCWTAMMLKGIPKPEARRVLRAILRGEAV